MAFNSQVVADALWHHYARQLPLGLYLSMIIGACWLIGNAVQKEEYSIELGLLFVLSAIGVLCVMAASGGLARRPLLRRLIRGASSRTGFVVGACLLFEVSGLLAAAIYWIFWFLNYRPPTDTAGQELLAAIATSAFMSFPWLLAELWSARKLFTELRMPPHAPSPAVV